MKTFFLMLSFFTRLPVPRVKYTEERYVRGLPMIPFVGIIMGLLLYALSFFHFLFHPPVVAMILLGGYIFITGGLHLDGLADTCDGIFSGRERERMLEIMKDSRIGSFGVLAMLFFFMFYMVMYQYLPYEALILLPIVGKSAPLISAYHADYIRPAGMGKLLVDNVGKKEYAIALLLPIIVSLAVPFAVAACGGEVLASGALKPGALAADADGAGFLSAMGLSLFGETFGPATAAAGINLVAVIAGMGSVSLLTGYLKKVLGGITGDTMGMVCETSQMVFVFAVYLLNNI